ncbi:MAG TPA: VWA domain-containing protein [Chitinophagales bacterium]|nr:VWA domain-containing protein [Chitinophagales bacterium]
MKAPGLHIRAIIITALLAMGVGIKAQETTRILFVLDASLSMQSHWEGGTKWGTATNALAQIADSLSHIPNVEMGLRVLGDLYPEPDRNCRDTRLAVRIDTNGVKQIKKELEGIHPKGITPLVYAIERAPEDFGSKPGKNVLIVITDGEDACDRDPCSVQQMLQEHNILLRPFIIGMSLQSTVADGMNCMGKLYNTNSAEEFTTTLKNIVTQSVSRTTLQVNLNDINGKPTETNVNMTFYNLETGAADYNFYHTLNARGLPDTLIIAPAAGYRLQVYTIPPVVADNIHLKKFQHNIINVKAPQGYLNFVLQGNASRAAAIGHIKCLVHLPGQTETINVQDINTLEKYLAGSYDLEITTLPRIELKDIKVGQSKTTDIKVPAPGILTINKNFEVYGAIFIVEKGEMKKIYDLVLKDRQETLALQPGNYRIVYRAKNSRTIHTTVDKEFQITSGGSLSLKL